MKATETREDTAQQQKQPLEDLSSSIDSVNNGSNKATPIATGIDHSQLKKKCAIFSHRSSVEENKGVNDRRHRP